MKILKIYIENFGCLHNYTMNFNSDVTVIEEGNGFGKTTLANFIKAMFYGLSSLKKSINENDRLKYAPWQGGLFGGYLDFELNEKKYRIERFFNPTGNTKDTFKLIDLNTNKPSKDYTKNIGEEIFGVDVDGYLRSSYLPQSNIEWSNQKISENLTKMLEASNETYDVAEALKKLNEESKKYVKTGNKGLIAETEAKISKLEAQIEIADLSKENTKNLNSRLEKITSLLEEYNSKLAKTKELIKEANEQHKKEAIFSHYQTLSQNKEKLKREIDSLVEFFKGEFPTKEQISTNYNLLEQLSIIQSSLNKLTSNDYIESEYQRLNNYFNVDQEINDEILKEKFKENEELKRISIERERISKEIDVVDNKLANETLLTQNHKMIYILLAFFGLVLGIPGVVMLVSLIKDFSIFIMILGISLTLSGLIFGAIALIIFLTRLNKDHQKLVKYKHLEEEFGQEKQTLSNKYLELEVKFSELNKKLKAFISKYEKINDSLINRFKADEDYLIELNNINQSYKTYIKLQSEYISRKEKLNLRTEEYQKIKTDLNKFTKFYLPNEEPFQALRKIQLNFDQYESLKNRYSIACSELTSFLENNVVEEKHSNHIYNLHELEKEEIDLEKSIENLIKEKYSIENMIRNDEGKIDGLFELSSQLEVEKELLVEYKHKYYVVSKTIEFIKYSQEKLASSYLGAIVSSFGKYVEKVLGHKSNFTLSTDLEITSEEYGSSKELAHYSTGSYDIITFCARLALIDAIYKNVKPTIILDDPFTNLDQDKLNIALEFVKDISKKYQVIYLICHESRKLGE